MPHGARSFLRQKVFRIESNPTQHFRKARIGTQRLKFTLEGNPVNRSGVFLDRAIKPAKRFISVSEGDVNRSDRLSWKVARVGNPNQFTQNLPRFFLPAEPRVGDGQASSRLVSSLLQP